MAKRFTATDIWDEDWFLDMPNDYKLFWYYMLSNCDHAGMFKINLRSFCSLLGVKVTSKTAIEYFNNGKQRIRIVSDSVWLIEDFFCYQYGNNFNPNNRVHKSIETAYKKNGISLTSIRGLKDHTEGVKAKAKDKDKDKDIVFKEHLNGIVVYNAEDEILKNQIEFQRICMATKKTGEYAKDSLHKYHLYLEEKEQYPRGKKAIFAGFEKWLLNEKNFINGTHKQSSSGSGTRITKSTGAEALVADLKNDIIAGGKQGSRT